MGGSLQPTKELPKFTSKLSHDDGPQKGHEIAPAINTYSFNMKMASQRI
jgi:hypothetical protein